MLAVPRYSLHIFPGIGWIAFRPRVKSGKAGPVANGRKLIEYGLLLLALLLALLALPALAQTPMAGASQISASGNQSCALIGGGVKCWGANTYGQLGDNSTLTALAAVPANGARAAISAMAVGNQHTCVLTTQGGVKCWGLNGYGQLGNNSDDIYNLNAVNVSGLTSGVTAIASGGDHTCALTAGGGVKCWGHNSSDLPSVIAQVWKTPVDIAGLASGVAQITAGNRHACALTVGGGVKCWGENDWGQLGNSTFAQQLIPVDVVGLTSGVTRIAAGERHTCAVLAGGALKCWGANTFGQLGNNTINSSHTAVDVSGLGSGVTQVAAGEFHTCALTVSDGVKCWGGFNGTAIPNHLTPVGVTGLATGVTALAAGLDHDCALMTGGEVKCWGRNTTGQLGDNSTSNLLTPRSVVQLTGGVTAITTGTYFSCALTGAGGVKCWGQNEYGQMGDGTTEQRPTAVGVGNLTSGMKAVVAGAYHACAITALDGVKCWGNNGSGELGNNWQGSRQLSPVDVIGLNGTVKAIAAGYAHTCVLTFAGGVKCWGWNAHGAVGDGTFIDRYLPVDVPGLESGVTALSIGSGQTCALITGGVKCWGLNGFGQVGDTTTTDRATPVDVIGLSSGVSAISAGGTHTCALTNAGGVKCWGVNSLGQLGDNTTTDHFIAGDVFGLSSGVLAINAGYNFVCARTANGVVKCWGYNSFGQLGDNSTSTRITPTEVKGLGTGVLALSAGGEHVCALTSIDGIKCWGRYLEGQLGDGTTAFQARVFPAAVLQVVPPDAPAIGSALAGNQQATVTFTAPEINGGSPITGYTVTSSPAGGIDSNAGSLQLSHVMTGLTNGVNYTFTVAAANKIGSGIASAASNAVTPFTLPGAPLAPTATPANAQATVSFSAPLSNGGAAISGYTVSSIPAGGVDSNAGGTGLSHLVTGLTNGVAYKFTVAATNIAGTGPISAASNSVVPRTVPGAPLIGTATAGNLQASVVFAAPASNGGSAITGYTVTSTPGGGIDSNAGSTGLSHVVTGLIAGVPYTFTVTASNAAGTGAPSGISNTVVPTSAPQCSLQASSTIIFAGRPLTLTASCTPAATSYVWTNSGFGSQVSGGSVSPLVTTTYSVKGINAVGIGNTSSVTVVVKPPLSLELFLPTLDLLLL